MKQHLKLSESKVLSQTWKSSLPFSKCHALKKLWWYSTETNKPEITLISFNTEHTNKKKNPADRGQQARENQQDMNLVFMCEHMGKRKKVYLTGKLFHRHKSCSFTGSSNWGLALMFISCFSLKVSVPGLHLLPCPTKSAVPSCTNELSLSHHLGCSCTICKYNCHLLDILHPV